MGSGSGKWRGAVAVYVGFGLLRIAAFFEGGGREQRSATGEAVTVGGFDDKAGGGHGGEALVESGGADAAGCPQFGERPRLLAVGEGCGDALIDGSRLDTMLGLAIGLEGSRARALSRWISSSVTPGIGGGGAMLDGQNDAVVTVAAEIEVGIAPGVELRRSAQGLTGADGAGALFGMMDERDGDGVAALQFAQEGEQRRDVAADILIDAMQAHERIEDEQPRLQAGRRSHRDVRGRPRDRGAGWAR